MMSTSNENGRLIRIGKKVFFSAFTILFLLILVSILLTYIIPKGTYGTVIVNGGEPSITENTFRLKMRTGSASSGGCCLLF